MTPPTAEAVGLLISQAIFEHRDNPTCCAADVSEKYARQIVALSAVPGTGFSAFSQAKIPTGALADIAAERLRQVEGEGWTLEHDDQHRSGQMANAAAVYAMTGSSPGRTSWDKGQEPSLTEQIWPWDRSWFKPSGNPRRDLVKAGALIVAEIQRLDRQAAPSPSVPTGDAEGAVVAAEECASGCGYTGYEFGGGYLDSTCIDGFLWDLDSCDEPGGGLTSGGDIPCPACNAGADQAAPATPAGSE